MGETIAMMKVYVLNINYDYQSVNFVDTDYYYPILRKLGSTSVKEEWGDQCIIRYLSLRLKKIKNCFSVLEYPAFDQNTLELLKDFFVSGELLPMQDRKGKMFYLYNVFPSIQCLDTNNPDLVWNSPNPCTGSIMSNQSKITFIEDKITQDIFKEKFIASSVYVTDKFVQRVLDNKLKGFQFVPIWDSERGYIGDLRDERIIT